LLTEDALKQGELMASMFENLEQRKLRGLKVATVGVCCALIGVLLFVLDFEFAGRVIIYCGFGITFLGIIFHFVILAEHLFAKKE
jgi:hypothetical protein